MFKHLILYRIGADLPASAAELEEAMASGLFEPCGKTQAMSVGWAPPRAEHGALVEAIGGHWILKMDIERRLLPTSVVSDRVDLMVEKIEEETGRKPGRKQRKDLHEEAVLELLPRAFTQRTGMLAWIDPKTKILAVAAGSDGKADDLIGLLVSAAPKMNLHKLQTESAPASRMAAWLTDGEMPAGFTIDRDGELKSADETKASVRYQHHAMDTDEVRAHLAAGKIPTQLALTWNDRVSFVMTDRMLIKKIKMLDVVFEGDRGDEDAFDADAAIATGELSRLIADLIEALGGEHVLPIIAAAGEASVLLQEVESDPIYDQAVQIVRTHGKPSISLVQRHLRIGYNRAARLLERMEIEGLVTPMHSNGSRDLRAAA